MGRYSEIRSILHERALDAYWDGDRRRVASLIIQYVREYNRYAADKRWRDRASVYSVTRFFHRIIVRDSAVHYGLI